MTKLIGYEKMQFCSDDVNCTDIDADLTNWSKTIYGPNPEEGAYYIQLDRKVTAEDLRNINLDVMPGFKLSWQYSEVIKPETEYSIDFLTNEFVRCAN